MTSSHREDTVRYAPIIELQNGSVRGTTLTINTDDDVHQYQGIRYARAKRFERSTPVEPWSGVYEATIVREIMPQVGLDLPSKGYYTHKYAEDSLFLNVWRPAATKPNDKLAVMVYLHGGRFKKGSIFRQMNDGRYIAATGGVIVVAFNYRLGAAGWMVSNSEGGKGEIGMDTNRGLYDMVLALEWVQQNIDRFGGDRTRVTIFGNSAGSISISLLLLCPRANGLFQRAILQSGVAIGLKHRNQMTYLSRELAKSLGINVAGSDDNVDDDCLRTITRELREYSIDSIIEATEKLPDYFWPVYGDDLLPYSPTDALKEGKFNANIDLMYGLVMDEALGRIGEKLPELFSDSIELDRDKCDEYIAKLMQEEGLRYSDDVARFYTALMPTKPNDSLLEHKKYIHAAYNGFYSYAPTVITGEQVARYARNRAHFQDGRHGVFSHKFYSFMLVAPAEVHVINVPVDDWYCACHGDDHFFLFMIPQQSKQRDRELSRRMIMAWANFARSGNPESLGDLSWTEALPENGDFNDGATSYMALDYEPRMVHNAYSAVVPFWKPKIFV